MLFSEFAAYKKDASEQEFHDSICENNFFIVLSTQDGLTGEKGQEILRKLASDIAEQKIEKLADLDAYISDFFKTAELPAHFSVACGYLIEHILLLKTVGKGTVFIQRQGKVNKLLGSNLTASGHIENGDVIIFSVNVKNDADPSQQYKKALEKGTAEASAAELGSILGSEDHGEKVALFAKFENKEQELTQEDKKLVDDPTASVVASEIAMSKSSPIKDFIDNVRSQLQGQDKKKKITMIVVAVVLVVFIWSVILGYQRRANAAIDQKTQETKELVTEKLRQADDVAFLNLARATALINDAKEDVRSLKKELKGKKENEVKDLEKIIAEHEERILKKEERVFEEFFDLSVEDKQASGTRMYLDEDTLSILDSNAGAVYLFSLSKKSLDKKSASQLRGGSMVANTGETILVFQKGKGIVAVDAEGKTSEAVDNDPGWGSIDDMITYNKNLYLLDGQKGDIYKYVPAEKGFSGISSYFKGQDKPNIVDSNSLAIDLSVYVGFPDAITKFTSGVKEEFNPTFPESGVHIDKILTGTDIEKIYAWDKKKSTLYVVNKDGVYERQINSSIFSSADDVVVSGNNALVLKGSKIYTVGVN